MYNIMYICVYIELKSLPDVLWDGYKLDNIAIASIIYFINILLRNRKFEDIVN